MKTKEENTWKNKAWTKEEKRDEQTSGPQEIEFPDLMNRKTEAFEGGEHSGEITSIEGGVLRGNAAGEGYSRVLRRRGWGARGRGRPRWLRGPRGPRRPQGARGTRGVNSRSDGAGVVFVISSGIIADCSCRPLSPVLTSRPNDHRWRYEKHVNLYNISRKCSPPPRLIYTRSMVWSHRRFATSHPLCPASRRSNQGIAAVAGQHKAPRPHAPLRFQDFSR